MQGLVGPVLGHRPNPVRRSLPPLLTGSVALLAGLTLAEIGHYFPYAALTAAAIASVFLVRARLAALAVVLLLGSAYGYGRYWHQPADHISSTIGQVVTVTAVVAENPHYHPGGSRFTARVQAIIVDGQPHPASGLIRVSRARPKGDTPLAYGDRLTAPMRLRPITSLRNPGGFDYAAYQWRRGVLARTYLSRHTPVQIERARQAAPLVWLHGYRNRVYRLLQRDLSTDAAAFLSALAVGDTRAMPDPLRQQFQAAGMAHILAISGTHLGLLAGLVFLLVRGSCWLLPHRLLIRLTRHLSAQQWAGLFTLLAVAGYAALAGGRVPTLRALCMTGLVIVALLSSRRTHPITGLAVAASLILLWDPRALGLASLQLSFVAILAILLLVPSRSQPADDLTATDDTAPPGWWRRYLTGLLAVTLAAGAATAPLVAYHFAQVGWAGFVANLILLPLLGVTVLPVGLLAALTAPLAGVVPLAGGVDWLVNTYLHGVSWFAALPNAFHQVAVVPLPLLVATYTIALLLILGWQQVPLRTILIGTLVLACGWGVALYPTPPRGWLTVTFLDVGQGDSTVVTGPHGHTLIVDGGTRSGRFDTGRLAVAPFLRQTGVTPVAWLATHPQVDHVGGLIHLMRRWPAVPLYDNGDQRPTMHFYQDYIQAAKAGAGTPITVAQGDTLPLLAQVTITVVHPPARPQQTVTEDLNDRSVVLAVDFGQHRLLLTGDIEMPVEDHLLLPDGPPVTVLKIPHHGSRSSSGEAWLTALAPQLAVVSVGRFNPYHHPHPQVVERYRKLGIPLVSTAQDGAISVRSDGQQLQLRREMTRRLARIPPDTGPRWLAERQNWQRLLQPEVSWEPWPMRQ